MKISSKAGNEKQFRPFDLVITIENEEDAAKMYALFNTAGIVHALNLDNECFHILDEIESFNGCPRDADFFVKINDILKK